MLARAFHSVLAAALSLSLAAAPVVSFAADPVARAPGARPVAGTDEAGLWFDSDKAELQARNSAELNDDAALREYVRGVMCKVAPEYCSELRLLVMDRPYFNAQVAPNGYVEVWSGLLLRVENEAELAFALGHEVSHFAMNDSVERQRAMKTRGNAALVVGFVLAGAAMAYTASTAANSPNYQYQSSGGDNGALVDIAYLGAFFSLLDFTRDQEAAADSRGQDRLIAAGYDANASVTIWEGRAAEAQSSDNERVRKAGTSSSIFNTHPIDRARITVLSARLRAPTGPVAESAQGSVATPRLNLPAGAGQGDLGRERYRAAIRPFLGRWLRDDLRRRDYGQTLYLIDRLSRSGEDLGVLNYYRGEAYRLRRGTGDAALAIAAYEAAAGYADAPAATWRDLGNISLQQGARDKARTAFETYLVRAPDAQDRWIVEASLKKLATVGMQ